ncbi:MAG: serine/threonine-protein kinase [Gemmatimonadaceae bacterium]
MTTLEHLRSRLGERYRIERELGRGGMGAVYLARDLRLDRPVALKVLPAEYAVLPALRERFLRETRMAAGFSHPNIVPVYAIEEGDDLLAYAMGFVEGDTLAERVQRVGVMSVRETVKLLQDVGYALAYAHGRGVVHRDIKPDNIMIERATGRALVMDFGIARAIAAPVAQAGLTRVGEVVGTPEYMSPEQATGESVDGRSDLYSLGLTAYFALTGKPAMSGDSTGRILARQISEVLPPMITIRPDLPPKLAEAIDRCVAKDADARFANAEGLVEALDEAQLSAPEIPLAVRLFTQEASSLTMVLFAGGLLALLMLQTILRVGIDNIDNMLPFVLLLAVLITRVLQTMSEARRLAFPGFTPAEIGRGMRAVMDERATRRRELHADMPTRQARTRTLKWAVATLVVAVVLIRTALTFRAQIAGSYRTAPPGIVLVLAGMALLGVSLVLLLRSPFRMPLGERLFRLVWLGPIGHTALRAAGRKVPKGGSHATAGGASLSGASAPPSPAVSTTQAKFGSPGGDRIAQLEGRVAELERWRKNS